MASISVVVCGGINIDRTFAVDRLPIKGETIMGIISIHIAIQEIRMKIPKGQTSHIGVGGKAANTAVTCSKFGAKTSFIGALGDDPYTEMLSNKLKKYNISTDTCYHLKNTNIPCGQAYIFLMPDGDNSIVVVPAANASWPEGFTDAQSKAIKASDCILLQREVPESYNIRIAKIAKECGIKVVLDVGGEDKIISKELLSLIDVISPNETELERLMSYFDPNNKYDISTSKYSTMKKIKKACSVLQGLNKKMCILLKRGANGAMFMDENGNMINQSALKLDKDAIKDTTGAGDCFTGSFVVEWIRQQKVMGIWNKEKIEDKKRIECISNAMKFGCAAAGLSVQKSGTIASIPDLKDVVTTVLKSGL